MQEFGQSDLTIIFQRLLQDYGKSANTKAQTRKLDYILKRSGWFFLLDNQHNHVVLHGSITTSDLSVP